MFKIIVSTRKELLIIHKYNVIFLLKIFVAFVIASVFGAPAPKPDPAPAPKPHYVAYSTPLVSSYATPYVSPYIGAYASPYSYAYSPLGKVALIK